MISLISHSNKRVGWIIPHFWPDPTSKKKKNKVFLCTIRLSRPLSFPFFTMPSLGPTPSDHCMVLQECCKSATGATKIFDTEIVQNAGRIETSWRCWQIACNGGRFAVDSLIFGASECFWMKKNSKDRWVENSYGPSDNTMGKGQLQPTSRARHLGCIGTPNSKWRAKAVRTLHTQTSLAKKHVSWQIERN